MSCCKRILAERQEVVGSSSKTGVVKRIGPLLVLALSVASLPVASAAPAPVDYLTASFDIRRVLDWGDRPNWSPDGSRIVFTESDTAQGYAHVLDLADGDVDCLTCTFGQRGLVTRIYHLPDASYLIEAGPNLLLTELYWMPANASAPPQALGVRASGEVAISPRVTPDGGFRLAWSSAFSNSEIMTGELRHDGKTAAVANQRPVRRPPQADDGLLRYGEPYDFTSDDRKLLYWGIAAPADGEMYEVDLDSGDVRYLYRDPSHNETHLFPGARFGLEESNRASDPDSPVQGVSGLFADAPAGLGGPFDLFVVSLDDPSKVRRLTYVSDIGGQANQSIPAADGRRIAFVVVAPSEGPLAGKSGLYVGEFKQTKKKKKD